MKNKNQKIVTAVIVFFYAATLITYISFLGVKFSKGKKLAEATYTELSANISDILQKASVTSSKFKSLVTSNSEYDLFEKKLTNLAGFQLTVNENLIYSYPADLTSSPASKSSLVRFHSTMLTSCDEIPVNLTAAIYLLTPETIIKGGKVAFMVILIATLLAAFFLVYAYMYSKKNDPQPQEAVKKEEPLFNSEPVVQKTETTVNETKDDGMIVASYEDDRPSRDELFNNRDIEDITNDFFDKDDEEKPAANDNDFSIGGSIISFTDETPGAQNQESADTSAYEESEPLIQDNEASNLEDFNKAESNSPSGLFSPKTNFGWEPYLLPRLTSELLRSTEQEQDLSLLIIKIPGLKPGTDSSDKVCSLVIDTVKFQDLIFEFGDDGFSAIFQNTTVDEALSIADGLHEGIQSILQSYGQNFECAIGISSKSIRLISGERLANEACQALEHALNNPEKPIVAFRVNSDQYKNYLS